MRRIVSIFGGVVAGMVLLATLAGGTAAQAPLVCFRDGSCVPAGSTAVPPTPDGTRPPDVSATAVPSATVTREPQPTQEPTPAQVCFRDGSCVPWGSQ